MGDRVDIVGPEKEYLIVEQISLLFTVFKRIDNMKMVQVPNIVLNTLWIENITRSKAMKEQLDMFISFDTPLEDIELLRTEMQNFVRNTENSRDFQPDIILEATGIGNMDKLQLKVEIRHKSNWHNETVRAARRSKFMCALVLALRKIPIYAPGGGGEPLGGPTNPGYSVAITDELAAEARDKATKEKEAQRLVPKVSNPDVGKSSSAELGSGTEQNAAENLNRRRPTEKAADAVWSGERDSDTLNSREQSLERHRSNEIEDLKQTLLKRASTRGRRKPGDSVPSLPGLGPSMSLTAASPRREGFMPSAGQVLDEEAELGVYPTSSTQQYVPYSGQGYGGQHQQQQQQQSGAGRYSMFPPKSQTMPLTSQPVGGHGQQAEEEQSPGQSRIRRLSLGFKSQVSSHGGSGSGTGSGAL